VDVGVTDRVALEMLPLRLDALDLRQAADPVPLQAAMQSRPRQVRGRGPQRIEAIVERHQGMTAQADDLHLLFFAENS